MEAKTSLQQLRRQRASSGPDKVPVLVQTLDEYTRSITALYSYTSAAVVTEKAHATRRDASTRRNAGGLRAGMYKWRCALHFQVSLLPKSPTTTTTSQV